MVIQEQKVVRKNTEKATKAGNRENNDRAEEHRHRRNIVVFKCDE